jgi:hypothetical protein
LINPPTATTRGSEAVSKQFGDQTREERASDLRPGRDAIDQVSPRSGLSISAMRRAALPPVPLRAGHFRVAKIAAMMLLKLWATPLASSPTICKRSARSSRAVSLAFHPVLLAREHWQSYPREAPRGEIGRAPGRACRIRECTIAARFLQHDARPGANSETEGVFVRAKVARRRGDDAEPACSPGSESSPATQDRAHRSDLANRIGFRPAQCRHDQPRSFFKFCRPARAALGLGRRTIDQTRVLPPSDARTPPASQRYRFPDPEPSSGDR